MIGNAVKRGVKEALAKQSDLTPEKQKSIFRRGRRYGITAEAVWNEYIKIYSEKADEKLEYIEFIERIEKDEEIVCTYFLIYSSDGSIRLEASFGKNSNRTVWANEKAYLWETSDRL